MEELFNGFIVMCPGCSQYKHYRPVHPFCETCGTLYDEVLMKYISTDLSLYLMGQFKSHLYQKFRCIQACLQKANFLLTKTAHTIAPKSQAMEVAHEALMKSNEDLLVSTAISRLMNKIVKIIDSESSVSLDISSMKNIGITFSRDRVVFRTAVFKRGDKVTFQEASPELLAHPELDRSLSQLEVRDYRTQLNRDIANKADNYGQLAEDYKRLALATLIFSDDNQEGFVNKAIQYYKQKGNDENWGLPCKTRGCYGYILDNGYCLVCGGRNPVTDMIISRFKCFSCGSMCELYLKNISGYTCRSCMKYHDLRAPGRLPKSNSDYVIRYYCRIFNLDFESRERPNDYNLSVLTSYLYVRGMRHELVVFWCLCYRMILGLRYQIEMWNHADKTYSEFENLAEKYLLDILSYKQITKIVFENYCKMRYKLHCRYIMTCLARKIGYILDGIVNDLDFETGTVLACNKILDANHAFWKVSQIYGLSCMFLINDNLDLKVIERARLLEYRTEQIKLSVLEYIHKHYYAGLRLSGMIQKKDLDNRNNQTLVISLKNMFDETKPYSIKIPEEIKVRLREMSDYRSFLGSMCVTG